MPDMHFCYLCITQLWNCTHIKCWSCQTRLLHCSIDQPNLSPSPPLQPQSVVVVDLWTLFGVQYVVPSNVSDYYFCTYLVPTTIALDSNLSHWPSMHNFLHSSAGRSSKHQLVLSLSFLIWTSRLVKNKPSVESTHPLENNNKTFLETHPRI
jgi:hypothetical protein